MPNHIYSRLTLSGDRQQIEDCISAAEMLNEKGTVYVDFSSIFPCPEELLRVECGNGATIVSQKEYDKKLRRREVQLDEIPLGGGGGLPITQKMADNYKREFGFDNWYAWCVANWGTKWGIYDVSQAEENPHQFTFQTAWSPAKGLWLNISKKYPDVLFATEFADEGSNFVGREVYQNGKIVESSFFDWDSEEGVAARKIVGYYRIDEDEDEDDVED